MQNPSRVQATGLSLELFHVQTNTSFELPPDFVLVRIGKPKDRIIPDINVTGLPNADFVSRFHAEIHAEDNAYYIADMGSANGTFLNNLRLKPGKRYPLNLGDKIDLGGASKVTFVFLSKQNMATESENTILNTPPTVLQVELIANTEQSHRERSSKFLGLVLMGVGILILTVNPQIGFLARIPGVLLSIIGVVILAWRYTYRNLGLALIGLGITVMLFTENAFTIVSFLIILASCILLAAGYQLFTSGRILKF